MSAARLKPLARQDLLDIEEFIAEDNPIAAVEFTDMLQQKCDSLAANPYIGVTRSDLVTSLRMFPIRDYLIFYLPTGGGVDIARIVHASRDINALIF